MTPTQYGNAIQDIFKVAPSAKYPGLYGKSLTGYSTEPGLGTVSADAVKTILDAAEEVAVSVAGNLGTLLPCSTSSANDACANTFLDNVGRLAFRRALTASERQSLIALYQSIRTDGGSFSDGVATMVAQLLQMPQFLYVAEAAATAGADRGLTSLELSTRLAQYFWDSVPDKALLDFAEGGKLANKAAVLAEAKRMLADPKSDRALKRFFREWTGTTELKLASKDAATFPNLDADLASAINESFDRFVADQVRAGGTVESLLRSNTAFVNAKLATFFKVPTVANWQQVELPADRYSGIATQPALMAALSHAAESSFVFRGKFLRTRLECAPIGAPPADAMSAFAGITKPANPTGKEVAAAIESVPVCNGCHALLDPAGLVFEHFDALGGYRDKYASGKAIDTTGSLLAIGPAALAYTSPVDLFEQLSQLPETRACFVTQLFRYMASRGETGEDACSIKQIDSAVGEANGSLEEAFLQATQTDAFLFRRGE
jgi:hypothetical protein